MSSYFHLSYDDATITPSDLTEFLVKNFNATEFGRPTESTLVFKMAGEENDVDNLYAKLTNKFASSACFVISRVAKCVTADKRNVKDFILMKEDPTHLKGFVVDLAAINKKSNRNLSILKNPLKVLVALVKKS